MNKPDEVPALLELTFFLGGKWQVNISCQIMKQTYTTMLGNDMYYILKIKW